MTTLPIHNICELVLVGRDFIQFSVRIVYQLNWLPQQSLTAPFRSLCCLMNRNVKTFKQQTVFLSEQCAVSKVTTSVLSADFHHWLTIILPLVYCPDMLFKVSPDFHCFRRVKSLSQKQHGDYCSQRISDNHSCTVLVETQCSWRLQDDRQKYNLHVVTTEKEVSETNNKKTWS